MVDAKLKSMVHNERAARGVLAAYLCEVLHSEAKPCAGEWRAS